MSVSLIDGHIDDDAPRMTDNEIIKALECCGKYHTNYKDQPCEHCAFNDRSRCVAFLIDNAIGLINRQKAEIESNKAKIKISAECIARQDKEIERLHNENAILTLQKNVYNSEIKAEAVKEFAEKLKKKTAYLFSGYSVCIEIDNLVKEMVGDAE